MMEWIVAILVVVIVLMAAYIRGLWTKLAEEEKDACGLSRELESKQLEVYAANDAVDRSKELHNAVFDIIGAQLSIHLDHVKVGLWHDAMTKDIVDATALAKIIADAFEKMRKEAEAGNRAELVRKLSELFKAMQLEDITFTEFLREFETIPSATYNRIAVHVLRQQK